jgi:glycosyltransferase involved in cell wall biosynthesis
MDVLYSAGHTLLKIRETLAGYRRRFQHLRQATNFDLAFVYREATLLGPPVLERRLAGRGPLIFDFDDAIYLPPANPSSRWASRLRPLSKTARLCEIATHVTVGNETLAVFARSCSAAVSVVPSTIDTIRYVPRDRPPNPRPVIGWTGSTSTVPYLEMLRGPLLELRRRIPFQLRVIGGMLTVPGLDLDCLPWSPHTEVEDLRPLDVGVMPLPDDAWTRGKCGLKALQYMALGIPPVVSPVGVNRQIVEDGENGLHASTEKEWVDRMALLLSRPDLRKRLGAVARRTVEERYSSRVWVPKVAGVFRAAAAAGLQLRWFARSDRSRYR